jgi:hypothetical protein
VRVADVLQVLSRGGGGGVRGGGRGGGSLDAWRVTRGVRNQVLAGVDRCVGLTCPRWIRSKHRVVQPRVLAEVP